MFTFKQSFTSSAVFTALLWLLIVCSASAQVVHDRVFGTPTGTEEIYSMVHLRDGGFMLAGEQSIPPPVTTSHLYLLRRDATGDTLWSKRWTLPGCYTYYPHYIVEAATAGHFLVAGQSFSFDGTTQSDVFLVMCNAQGDTLWTKRTQSISYEWCARPQLLPNGDFLVVGQLNNAPSMQRISPTGQVV